MIRSLTAAVAAVAATLTLTPAARAALFPTGPLPGGGGFVIQSCGESGSSEGWTASNNAPARLETFTDCPPSTGRYPEFPEGRYFTGLHAGGRRGRDSPTLADAQAGDQAELTFTANTGTQITRIRMWRAAGKDEDNDWLSYTKAGATTIDACEYALPQAGCMAGGPGQWAPNGQNDTDPGATSYYDSALPGNLPSLAVSTFTLGVQCRFQGNNICTNAYLFSASSAEVYSAFFTLTDSTAPAIGPGGGGFSGSQLITERPAFTTTGTDNSGIRAARLYLDGTLADEQLASCSYDRPRPCTDLASSQPLGFDPSQVSDGNHELQLAVVDAAGNETRTPPVTRQIDGTPPAAPELTQAQAQTNQSTISWQPASAGAIATTGSQWRICDRAENCSAWTTLSSPSGSIDQPVYEPLLTARVRSIDALGRTGPEASIALTWTYIPPPATSTTTTGTGTTPTTPTTTTPAPPAKKTTSLKLAKPRALGGRVVALSGTVSVKNAKLTVTLTRKGHKRITRYLRAKTGKLAIRIRNVPRGRWTITLRYAGSSTTKPANTRRTITVR